MRGGCPEGAGGAKYRRHHILPPAHARAALPCAALRQKKQGISVCRGRRGTQAIYRQGHSPGYPKRNVPRRGGGKSKYRRPHILPPAFMRGVAAKAAGGSRMPHGRTANGRPYTQKWGPRKGERPLWGAEEPRYGWNFPLAENGTLYLVLRRCRGRRPRRPCSYAVHKYQKSGVWRIAVAHIRGV